MDETPCYFVIHRSSTIDKKGVQDVKVKTTSAEHLCFTVALTKNVFSAFRVPPLLICKIWRMFLQVNVPLECKFLLPRVENEKANDDKNLREPHLHSAKSHSGGEVEQAFSGVKCSVKIIHGILTRLLLFLETNVNTRTHDTHVNRWEVWVENGEGEFTKWEFARCASYQLVAEWADDSWKKAATGDLILKGFRQYDYVEYA